MTELREWQVEAVAAVRADWREVDRTLVVMATGTGKTHTFLAVLDEERQAGTLSRALVIAHRRELIYQPLQRAMDFFPELGQRMGVVMADKNEIGAQHVVATVQTLADVQRVAYLLRAGPISHMVIDECHHATAETYRKLIERVGPGKVLGVTATPLRTDGDGLSRVFQKVSYRLPISAAIRRGALVPFDALGVVLPISFAGIKETREGWERESLGDVLRAENVLEIVHDKWREYAGDRQTIAFTASVAQARETADYLAGRGVKAAWVSGETPTRERDRLLKAFQRGELQVVCNCMVLTEGFDAPETSAVLMIAPTRSDLIYVQRLGRGLRTAPSKTDCRVLDFAPIEERNVVMAGDVLGKPREVRKAEAQAERQGVLIALSVNSFGEAATIDPAQLVVRVLNLLRRDSLAWTLGKDYYATATLDAARTVCIALPHVDRLAKADELKRAGEWSERHTDAQTFLSSYRLYDVNGTARLVGMFDTMDEAKGRADDLALELSEKNLSSKKAHWRQDAPSAGQVNYLQKLGLKAPAGCTRGQAAQLITHALAGQAVSKKEHAYLSAIFRGRVTENV